MSGAVRCVAVALALAALTACAHDPRREFRDFRQCDPKESGYAWCESRAGRSGIYRTQ